MSGTTASQASPHCRERHRDLLGRLVRPHIRVLGRQWPAFQVCGTVGFLLALTWALVLGPSRGLSPSTLATIALVSAGTFFGLAMAVKVVSGRERIVNYAHQLAVLGATGAVLHLLDQPALPYLDVTVLCLGLFIACGRLGCLMSGCCHGRPHRWGLCYREEHLEAGLTPGYARVRLFPVQAVTSAWLLGIVAAGSIAFWKGTQQGAVLAWYLVAYGVGRFYTEFARGDPGRRQLWGFSAAQWTSIALLLGVVCVGRAGLVPARTWHTGALALLLVTAGIVAVVQQSGGKMRCRLLGPNHVHELAQLLLWARSGSSHCIGVGRTSLGLQVSAGRSDSAPGAVHHYAFSYPGGHLDPDTVEALAELICRLGRVPGPREIVESSSGVYHILVQRAHPMAPQGAR